MKIKRVKHSRQELRAIKLLSNAQETLGLSQEAKDILLASQISLTYYYPSEREVAFRDTLNVLRICEID